MIVIVMGVSGSGKTTVGIAIADLLGCPFIDGDDLHSAANVAKMASGHPLTDADRAPWLAAIGARMDAFIAAGDSAVIACSALRRSYRDSLRSGRERAFANGEVRFVLLDLSREALTARMIHRHGHFMPTSLLESQLATLERPDADEHAITATVDATANPVQTATAVLAALRAGSGADPSSTFAS